MMMMKMITMMICVQLTMLVMGVPVGYSSPNTMTDLSSAIKRGDKGDVSLLKPTLICSVPLVLIRIQKVRLDILKSSIMLSFQNMMEAVKSRGAAFEKVFNLCYEYKLKWNKDHCSTPILSALVFSKLK